jgi:hypothetical protein
LPQAASGANAKDRARPGECASGVFVSHFHMRGASFGALDAKSLCVTISPRRIAWRAKKAGDASASGLF